MKKYLFFAAAAIVAASCAKTPAPVQTPDGPEAPAVEGKVAVQFGTNVVANATTKASGPISGWSEQSLYILGFARTETGKAWDKPFINNVKAAAPKANPSGTPAVTEGSIKVLAKTDPEEEPFYYSGTTTYDFYGYYVDDAALDEQGTTTSTPKPGLQTDKYVLPIQINGGQDILLAQADPDYALAEAKDKNSNFDSAYPGFESKYAFSAYAARRDVHPILQFEHLLTQLQFKVESGTDFTSGTGSPQIFVDKIAITGLNTKADFCVASGDKTALGLTNFTSVNDVDKDELLVLTDSYVPLDHGSHVPVPSKGVDAVEVGTPIMLFPETSFNVELYLCQAGVTQEVEPIKRTINITDIKNRPDVNGKTTGDSEYQAENLQTKFTKGYSYTITFKVYGLESVDITAELAEWKDGGSITIDTDEKPSIF